MRHYRRETAFLHPNTPAMDLVTLRACSPAARMLKERRRMRTFILALLAVGSIGLTLTACSGASDLAPSKTADGGGDGGGNGSRDGATQEDGSVPDDDGGSPDDATAPEKDAASADAGGHDAANAGHDSGADAGHDSGADAGHDSGADAGAAFGAVCTGNGDCSSNACFIGGMGSYCSLHCTTATAATDCPVPPTSGVCNNQGYCKK